MGIRFSERIQKRDSSQNKEHVPACAGPADRVCDEVCSLPLHPLMTDADVDFVASAVQGA